MNGNTIRVQQQVSNGAVRSSGKGLFAWLERRLGLEAYLAEGFPVHYLPKIVFVVSLGIFYIGNTHKVERTIREINELQAEVEDLRADYITAKSELMYASKQSEVARKVAPLGLKESLVPPFKIVLKEE
ncbi:MAG: FtsL-like putative cell division protein [Cyclobacteriaceae bacterium]|nr:FtsL-like putative cell division protein [Cyclobacteriaceae bacterium]MDW8331020.1 FtsL-like putative cell division protein [Cyclobacteriaceae bacterium]